MRKVNSSGKGSSGKDRKDAKELLEILKQSEEDFEESKSFTRNAQESRIKELQKSKVLTKCQFSQISENQFSPCGPTTELLDPHVYSITISNRLGLIYTKVPMKIEDLIRFPDSNSDRIIEEIIKFWECEEMFEKFGYPYKRGMLLWGPAGSGKSSTVQQIIKDVIDREGVVFLFDSPTNFTVGYNTFRDIQPETPIVVIMEDLDSIIGQWGEQSVLQILDGVHKIHKTIFIATTNYPEKLKARVINRPSRFDKVYKIDPPNATCRKIYLESVKGDEEIDLDKWVFDSEGFSFAHLKELFIATKILGNSYEDALDTIMTMKKRVMSKDSEEFDKEKIGFGKMASRPRGLGGYRRLQEEEEEEDDYEDDYEDD